MWLAPRVPWVRAMLRGQKIYARATESGALSVAAVLSGQVPYALVHTADGSPLDAAAVQEFLRERIAGYKVPHTVQFVDAPLRDDAGKARRSAVRADILTRLGLAEAR